MLWANQLNPWLFDVANVLMLWNCVEVMEIRVLAYLLLRGKNGAQ